jgi:predicted permease
MSRVNPQDALQQQSSRVTSGIIHQKLQSMFVVAQVALAFTLLTGAGLMLNSQIRIANERIGFAVDDLLAVQLDFPDARFRRPTGAVLASNALAMEIDPQIRITAESIRQSLEALPNVISASGIAIFPPMGGAMNMPIHIDGPTEAQQRAQFLPVLAGYFQTLQVPLFQGREFGSTDTAGSTPVAIISETMARRFWPNENPLGKHVQIESPMLPDERSREIIGIVGEVKQYLGQEPRPQLYLPYTQVPLVHDERLTNGLRNVTFVLRTSSPAAPMMASIKAAVRSVDAGQAVSYVQSMRQTAFGNQRRRVYAGFVITFGAIAVILAMIGVYGVIAQTVNQRTNEIGIRMALGADTWRVRRLVIRHGVMMIGAGLLCGTAGALALTRLIRNNLFGITPTDPLTFGAALTVLAAIALAACYIPARRASRIDPVLALRHE